MKFLNTILVVMAFLLLTPSVSAWAIGWWESEDCNISSDGPWAFYNGSGDDPANQASRLIPGQPGSLSSEICQWRTSLKSDPQDCTAAMNPPAGSFIIPIEARCLICPQPDCDSSSSLIDLRKPYTDRCIKVSDIWETNGGKPVYFWCFDEDQPTIVVPPRA